MSFASFAKLWYTTSSSPFVVATRVATIISRISWAKGGAASIWPYHWNGENQNLQKDTSLCPEYPRAWSLKLEAEQFKRDFVNTFPGCLPPPQKILGPPMTWNTRKMLSHKMSYRSNTALLPSSGEQVSCLRQKKTRKGDCCRPWSGTHAPRLHILIANRSKQGALYHTSISLCLQEGNVRKCFFFSNSFPSSRLVM